MRYLLFFIVFFALPHASWIPVKLGVEPENIPLGLVNIVLLLATLLWLLGRIEGGKIENPFKIYSFFTVLVILWVGVAVITGYNEDIRLTLTSAKGEISLLLLYFVPLAIIKNEKQFIIFFAIALTVHAVIGLEVLRSGVLDGVNFNDAKRGSGPFAQDMWGADIAGSFLAQFMMFFLAILVTSKMKSLYRVAAAIGLMILFGGLMATYARGAMLACVGGAVLLFIARGLHPKYFIVPLIFLVLALPYLPESVQNRFNKITNEYGDFDQSTQGRFYYYSNALELIMAHPLGVGTGQVRGAMEQKTGKFVDPHNGYLYTAVEYGVAGLAIFLLLQWRLFTFARKVYQNIEYPLIYRVYSLGMIGMLGVFVLCNLFYANFYKELVLGTITIHFGMLAYVVGKIPEKMNISGKSCHPPN